MAFDEFVFDDDMGAGCAEVSGGAFAGADATSSEKLDFDGDGEVLIQAHAGGGLSVNHDAVVAKCPAGPAGYLVADEAVFDTEEIIGVFLGVKEMAELPVEFFILGVIYTEDTILDSEGIFVVFAEGMAGEFWCPVGEIFAVEEGLPYWWGDWIDRPRILAGPTSDECVDAGGCDHDDAHLFKEVPFEIQHRDVP